MNTLSWKNRQASSRMTKKGSCRGGKLAKHKLDRNAICAVCSEKANGMYFGALVCLPCKSFFIRCTKERKPLFICPSGGSCDIRRSNRMRCQSCRYQKCLTVGMARKEKPESVEPSEGEELCRVCLDIANGTHFGVLTCEGCKKFFRRALKEYRTYACKFKHRCSLNPRSRNACRYCRYKKCLDVGMSREAIRMGRPKKIKQEMPDSYPSHLSECQMTYSCRPSSAEHCLSPMQLAAQCIKSEPTSYDAQGMLDGFQNDGDSGISSEGSEGYSPVHRPATPYTQAPPKGQCPRNLAYTDRNSWNRQITQNGVNSMVSSENSCMIQPKREPVECTERYSVIPNNPQYEGVPVPSGNELDDLNELFAMIGDNGTATPTWSGYENSRHRHQAQAFSHYPQHTGSGFNDGASHPPSDPSYAEGSYQMTNTQTIPSYCGQYSQWQQGNYNTQHAYSSSAEHMQRYDVYPVPETGHYQGSWHSQHHHYYSNYDTQRVPA